MESDKNYWLSLLVAVCMGGFLSCNKSVWTGYEDIVLEDAVYSCDSMILSLNELLFDPVGDGADYVEVVNVSDSEIDLSVYYIHNRNSKGELGKGYVLSDSICILQSGGYCLLTSDTASVAASYGCSGGVWLQVKGFPSMPNAGGTVVLTDTSGIVIDECSYLPAMHHPLLSDREGIALEKLHPRLSSSQTTSWASAAADVSYGTPGRRNSQFRHYLDDSLSSVSSGGFFLPRRWLSPSSDDSTAFLTLVYGNIYGNQPVATIEAYSRHGEKVATLADNAIMGTNGLYIWYGQDDKGNLLPSGQYILRTQTYDLSGHVVRRSFVCSVIGKLREYRIGAAQNDMPNNKQ